MIGSGVLASEVMQEGLEVVLEVRVSAFDQSRLLGVQILV